MQRFRQFVNTDVTDATIQFVSERGQPRPATEAEKQAELATELVSEE